MVRALILLLALTPFSAPAWNKPGHMAIGAIAHDVLKQDDPAAIARVTALLKQHPSYAESWAPKLTDLPDDQRDRALFMFAAKWADDIRGNKEFDRPTWHYINIPYKPAGEPDSLQPPPAPPINIVSQTKANLDIAAGKGPADQQTPAARAVAAGWVFHLVGDVHQPLHAVSLFTRDFRPPTGDRGGTFFYVRATADARPVSLHKIWDDLLTGTETVRDAGNVATALRLDKDLAKDKLTELAESDPEKWASAESFNLAKEKVYAFEGKMVAGAKTGADDTPVLPDGYLKEAKRVAERRAVLAGYRLAALLKSIP
ncbi:MAG TPA: S1/P1 nuclease [Tepidisphaeraceae bacterium]|nr:S1/P1 nuclease [Tepidisphaeraceae bacterium]